MEMLIAQALDERDLLKKKIEDAIIGTTFVSAKRVSRSVCYNNAEASKYEKDTTSTYQSIKDMIKRYYMIIQKIAESNAKTKIKVNNTEMTISAAISILKDISSKSYFYSMLMNKMEKDYKLISDLITRNNNVTDQNKNNALQAIISRNDDKKTATNEQIESVNKLFEDDYSEFVDPINITDVIKELREEDNDLRNKIQTAIKISNATTVIEID